MHALRMHAPVREDAPDPLDAALARAVRGGDHAAFRALYERYAPAVLGFLASRLGDHALAEDSLQETFCKAFRAIGSFDETRPFGPWIAAIAENVATDEHRRRARPRLVPASVDTEDPLRVASRLEREEILRAALASLPPDPRRVLLLRYQRGLTQRETAEQIGCSVRTAQKREEEALEAVVRLLDARKKTQEKRS